LGEKKTETITPDIRTFDAFRLLGDEYVTALPVVDKESGKLLANLSASDLRGLTVPKLRFLNDSVETFLTAQTGGVRAPVAVKNTATLGQVIQLVVENGIHRVWLTDDKDKPAGVVTLSDILGVFKGAK